MPAKPLDNEGGQSNSWWRLVVGPVASMKDPSRELASKQARPLLYWVSFGSIGQGAMHPQASKPACHHSDPEGSSQGEDLVPNEVKPYYFRMFFAFVKVVLNSFANIPAKFVESKGEVGQVSARRRQITPRVLNIKDFRLTVASWTLACSRLLLTVFA